MNDFVTGSDDPHLMAMAGDLRMLISQLKRRLREQAALDDFTPSQISALFQLEKAPSTVTALAQTQGVRPQSMGATIAALEAANLIVPTPDPADGRKTLWSLTQDARQRVTANRAARSDWLSRAIHRELNADEQAQLATGLALLRRLANS
jgi:DNA-binding MarR family transcriptional regulator